MDEIDKLITRRGPDHQKSLRAISVKLERAVLDESRIFNVSTNDQIERFEREKANQFPQMLLTAYQLYRSSEASLAPGHEATHVIDALSSSMRIFQEFKKVGKPLREIEEFEIALAVIAHDVGRYAEPYFFTGHKDHEADSNDTINARNLEILMPFVLGRKATGRLGIPESLGDRILYDIASRSVPTTGHLTADIVHQCDREQLGGTVMIPRLVALGIGVYGMDFIVPPTPEMSTTDLPNINKVPVDKLLTRLEFWMRNVYPPISPLSQSVDDQRKRETAVILMLGLHEMDEEAKIVFAPEMQLVNLSQLSNTKKPLQQAVFQEAQREYLQFLSEVDTSAYTNEQALKLARNLLLIEGTTIPDKFDQSFMSKTAINSPTINRNRWLIMLYALHQRHQKRLLDIERLNEPRNGVAETIRNIVLSDLRSRESIYNRTYRAI